MPLPATWPAAGTLKRACSPLQGLSVIGRAQERGEAQAHAGEMCHLQTWPSEPDILHVEP